jgi:prepilin-type N-terminal cleavage/methylation domain-containing protein
MSSGTPVQRRKLGVCMAKRKQKMKRLDHGGYSLVELMVVIVIMVILASVSIGVYNGYVNRARSAVFYDIKRLWVFDREDGHKICEAEHGLSGEFDKREMAEEIGNIMKKPNDPDSPLYLYVGEDTDDCTDFTLSFKNTGDGKMEINGFTYTADTYEIRWTEDDGVKVTME